MTDRKRVRPHSYAFQVFSRGAWGTVTSCGRPGHDHVHEECMDYLREMAMRWEASRVFEGVNARFFDTKTRSLLR